MMCRVIELDCTSGSLILVLLMILVVSVLMVWLICMLNIDLLIWCIIVCAELLLSIVLRGLVSLGGVCLFIVFESVFEMLLVIGLISCFYIGCVFLIYFVWFYVSARVLVVGSVVWLFS